MTAPELSYFVAGFGLALILHWITESAFLVFAFFSERN